MYIFSSNPRLTSPVHYYFGVCTRHARTCKEKGLLNGASSQPLKKARGGVREPNVELMLFQGSYVHRIWRVIRTRWVRASRDAVGQSVPIESPYKESLTLRLRLRPRLVHSSELSKGFRPVRGRFATKNKYKIMSIKATF